MCQECGCGLSGQGTGPHSRTEPSFQGHGPGHPAHGHDLPPVPAPPHSPSLSHPATEMEGHDAVHEDPQTEPGSHLLQVQRSLLENNQLRAERNRGYFQAKRLLVLNMVSAPGSGKTALIERTAEMLRPQLRLGAIVGDLATDNDAQRLRSAGIPVVQIATGTLCHLEAGMVGRALESLDLDAVDVLVIENVGNLVCPAAYDLGEHLRVVLLSVTEGEDKPLKYPPLFHSANVALVTKTDLADVVGCDRPAILANLKRVSHHARIFEVSARSGAGMDAWCGFLTAEHRSARGQT